MIETLKTFFEKYNIKNKSVVIGFSSGPDSCALAHLTSKLKKDFNLELILAYFNHNWRQEAKEEELFTIEFANKINAKYYIEQAPKNSKKNEETARELRYNFFENCAKKYNTDIVLLGHNKNDNVETLIYRIIKGTSIKGLNSIPENRDIYYRPLLKIEKKDILEYLEKNNIAFKIDSSNEDIKYKRNLIRKIIMPQMALINNNYLNSIENLIQNSINTKLILDEAILSTENKIIINQKIKLNDFINLKKPLRLEILNNYLKDYLKYRTSKNIKRFDEFILNNNKNKISINKNCFLIKKNNEIFIETKHQKNETIVKINSIGEYYFEDGKLTIEKIEKGDKIYPNSKENICFLNFNFPLELRHRKNGDKFCPYGLKSDRMKLKDFLINEKIEQNKKDKIVLLANKEDICWVIGYKISNKYKQNNTNCYKLTWRKING